MAFKMPDNALMISLQIMGAITQAMQEAEGAFAGHGTGEQKKDFARKRARDLMKIQEMIDAGLMTPEQEAGVLETFDFWVEAIFSTWETAKLFKAPTPPTV